MIYCLKTFIWVAQLGIDRQNTHTNKHWSKLHTKWHEPCAFNSDQFNKENTKNTHTDSIVNERMDFIELKRISGAELGF